MNPRQGDEVATRSEYENTALQEYRMLQRAWEEAFVDVPDADGRSVEDMYHLPPALRKIIDDILHEGTETINETLDAQHKAGELELGNPTFDAAMNMFAQLTVMLAGRMYRLGEKMAVKLPFDSLQPCPCSIVTDEDFGDLETFLQEAAEVTTQLANPKDGDIVFGDGWVITSFGSKKG